MTLGIYPNQCYFIRRNNNINLFFSSNGSRLTPFDTPEIIAKRRLQNTLPETIAINTKERQLLRKEIVDKLYGNGAKKKDRQIWIVMGTSGAGKTSTLEKSLVKDHSALIINADNAKKHLPEYLHGAGKGLTTPVHKESILIRDMLAKKTFNNGDNAVIPIIQRELDKTKILHPDILQNRNLIDIVQELNKKGYDVHLRLVHIDPAEATKRIIKRFKETGSFLDPDHPYNIVGIDPLRYYVQAVERFGNRFASYEAFSNEVALGYPLKRINAKEILEKIYKIKCP